MKKKSVYFIVSWRDAAELSRKLEKKHLHYAVKQFPHIRDLAFVFSNLSLSQYVYLFMLIGREGIDYQV